MEMKKEEEILLKTWEKDKQYSFVYAIEEMAELTKELCKSLEGRGSIIKIANEIADVLVTVGVIQHIDKKTVTEKEEKLFLKLERMV